MPCVHYPKSNTTIRQREVFRFRLDQSIGACIFLMLLLDR